MIKETKTSILRKEYRDTITKNINRFISFETGIDLYLLEIVY